MLAYYIAFKILMIGGKFIEAIILAGGKLGLRKKNEDTVGRFSKGLGNIFYYYKLHFFLHQLFQSFHIRIRFFQK